MDRPIRVVFFGTPQYAVPALRALIHLPEVEVPLVVTQPDRPAGRGRRLTPPAVKTEAEKLGLRTAQPPTLRDEAIQAQLASLEADVFLVAAYGLIFSKRTLALPRLGCLNLHASILPAYRGAAPISAAILNGDDETGVTLMLMERGLDTGPTIAVQREPILSTHTTDSLTARLADAGARLVREALPRFIRGELELRPQPVGATLTRPLVKSDGQLDPRRPAIELERQVRAMWPWPRAWIAVDGTVVQVHSAVVGSSSVEVGRLAVREHALALGTLDGCLELTAVQLPGGRPIPGFEAARRGLIDDGATVAPPELPEAPLIRPA